MPGLSIHVVDISAGRVAEGMAVSVWAHGAAEPLAAGHIGANGLLNEGALHGKFAAGIYEARFAVAAFFKSAEGKVPFLDEVIFRFGIDDPQQHYHLPMKLTAWGLSCFRGGA